MNFQFYLEKLFASEDFEKFNKENSDAFLCSGFFSIDKTGKGDNQQHFDYFIPKLNKMFSFKLGFGGKVEIMPVENFGYENGEKITPISDNFDFSFEDIEKVVLEKMQSEKINKRIEKLIWSIQNRGGKNFMIGTIFISGLGMIKVSYNLDEKNLEGFEKKSFFDFFKIIRNKK